MVIKYLVATQEKTQLSHALKYFKGDTPGVVKKRLRVKDSSVFLEDHQKVVAEIEKK